MHWGEGKTPASSKLPCSVRDFLGLEGQQNLAEGVSPRRCDLRLRALLRAAENYDPWRLVCRPYQGSPIRLLQFPGLTPCPAFRVLLSKQFQTRGHESSCLGVKLRSR
jgi:hypothetical protein